MEDLLQTKFEKTRQSSDGSVFELDGYCSKVGVAFEYNGPHHYKETFYCNQDRAQKFRRKDAEKEQFCAQAGIVLIKVPYFVSLRRLPLFIERKLREAGLVFNRTAMEPTYYLNLCRSKKITARGWKSHPKKKPNTGISST